MLCAPILLAGVCVGVAQEPEAGAYEALIAGLIELDWMCEAPRPGEGLDPLESASNGEPIEFRHVRGPGVVARIWCSRADGVLELYADGATTPAMAWPLADFAARDASSPLPPDPLAGPLGTGWYSVLPLPFQREARIVWRPDPGRGPARMQVDVRRLGEGASVPSASAALLAAARSEMDRVARTILDDTAAVTTRRPNITVAKAYTKEKLDPAAPHYDGTFFFPVTGDGIIRWFELTLPNVTDPVAMEREIRQLELVIEHGTAVHADRGDPLLVMPLGELMGSGIGYNPYDHYLMGVRADGRFVFRLPMPYSPNLQILFRHPTKQGVNFRMRIAAEAMPPEKVPPLRLHGGWFLGDATEAPALDVPGPARLVSYAWSSQSASDAPWTVAPAFRFADFLAHPRPQSWSQVTRRDGPGRFGRSTMLRIFCHDAPTAGAGERLVVEPPARFSGAAGAATVSARALWYGPLNEGSFGSTYAPEARATQPVAPPNFFFVEGAIEAESAKVLGLTPGATLSVEDGSARLPGLSRREALVLTPRAADAQVILGISAAIGGEYELVARFVNGPGHGTAQFFLDGKRVGENTATAAAASAIGEEVVLTRGTFVPRETKVALRSVDGKPLVLDYLRLRKPQ